MPDPKRQTPRTIEAPWRTFTKIHMNAIIACDFFCGTVLFCFLAYVLWKTLGQTCKSTGLGDEPRKVLDEIAGIQTVDVILPTRCGQRIRKRCVGKPTEHQAILLQKLGLTLPRSLEVVDL